MRNRHTMLAARAVENAGLRLPVNPDEEMPQLPDDLTEITDGELMHLLACYTTWAEYAAGVVATHTIDEETHEADLDREKALAALRHQDRKTVAAQKAAALADPDVQAIDENYRAARARRLFAEVVMTGAERKAAVVSRELTRRVGRHDREARTTRWNP